MTDQPKSALRDIPKAGLGLVDFYKPAPAVNKLVDLLAGYPFQVEGRWYHKKKVTFDGYSFVRCRFDECEIIIGKGTFAFDHCHFVNCQFYYSGDALNVIKAYNINAKEAWSLWPALTPTINTDGTISLWKSP